MDEETSVLMDETIWKELPEELLESVIARLPIATFIRFRLVCHKWNSLPFLQCRTQQELPMIYAALYGGGCGAMYDTLVKKWYYNTHHSMYGPPRNSGGGLICYADYRNASFQVGNYLTQTWKVFRWPASSAQWGFALAFVYNPSGAGGYKIVWLDREGKYGVHDYSSPEEVTVGRIPANFALHSPRDGDGLAIGSVAYFRCCDPEGILSYDVVSGTWEQQLIADPPNNSSILSLAEGGGRLLLVGWVDCNAAWNRIRRPCVCVWGLDTQTRSWREVDRMPTSYCPHFDNAPVTGVCMSTRRLLVILLSGWLKKKARIVQKIFAYDVVSQEWSKIPDCIPPAPAHLWSIWYGISKYELELYI